MSHKADNIVRLRGLPWTASNEDINTFLEGCAINEIQFIYTKEGKPSGEAFVELSSEEDFNLALKKHQQYMGKRYIDVFETTLDEKAWSLQKSGVNPRDSNEDAVIKLRGLPFSCDREGLIKFFDGLPVTSNGVSLMTDPTGNATGEAFVQFANQGFADVALRKHMERIGHRYVEIFKSSLQEARSAIAEAHRAAQDMQDEYQRDQYPPMRDQYPPMRDQYPPMRDQYPPMRDQYPPIRDQYQYDEYQPRRPTLYDRTSQRYDPYGRRDRMKACPPHNNYYDDNYQAMRRPPPTQGGRPMKNQNSNFASQTGFSIFMRGLPFSATDNDVMEFFSPVVPSAIFIERDHDGRSRGEGQVDFVCRSDADQAMTRDRASMKHRYIELFYTGNEDSSERDSYGSSWNAF